MRSHSIGLSLAILVLGQVLMARTALWAAEQAAAHPAPAEAVFELHERPVFDAGPESERYYAIGGARATCQEQPFTAVKAYPALRSTKPIYGLLRLAPDPNQRESGTPLYFVIDESGEAPAAAAQQPEQVEADRPSLLQRLSAALFGDSDEPAAVPPVLKNTFDRLYVDRNGDLDLTNDPVVVPMKSPPAGAVRRYSSLVQGVVFEEVPVPIDLGADLGSHPVRLVPRLEIQEYESQKYTRVTFIAATVREGDIQVGNRRYHAFLAQQHVITGRYDSPYTQLVLTSRDNPNGGEYWWGFDQLKAMRRVGGQYYTTSTTPLGDKLMVKPYQGDMGILRIGPGKRQLDRLSIQGSLESTTTVLGVGDASDEKSGLMPASECRLPVGDYIPDYVTIEYGRLRLSISQNYHSDGKPRNSVRNAWVYGIKIRKDEPFVWDFSNPPEVMFASPATDQTVKRGDEVEVNAVLIDPKLTIMIRGLVDTERKITKTMDLGNGRSESYEDEASLDPTVTITNAAGKTVAEGLMPFG